jgi:hypothetical protein
MKDYGYGTTALVAFISSVASSSSTNFLFLREWVEVRAPRDLEQVSKRYPCMSSAIATLPYNTRLRKTETLQL